MSPFTDMLAAPIFGHGPTRRHFEDDALLAAMVRAESALAQAQASLGLVPQSAADEIAALIVPDGAQAEIAAGVAQSGVPVPALVALLRRQLSQDAADWLHFGPTSQDIVDTAVCLCARSALDDLAVALTALIDALQAMSDAHSQTIMLARTRGQLATPITFGVRVAQWAQPLIKLEAEIGDLTRSTLRVQLGGASGSRSALGAQAQEVARLMAAELKLAEGPPWHTDRSTVASLANWLGRVVAATGKIGRDVSVSARGEIAELRVSASGGSSTMPHKSNPVIAEALQSLVPVATACEAGLAAARIHAEERDGAHWAVEWALLPRLFELAGAALDRAGTMIAKLEVDADAMRARVAADPAVWAEAAVFALAQTVGRVEAARLVSDALASGHAFRDALAPHDTVDWDAALSEASVTEPASQAAAQVFALREQENRTV